MALKRSEPEVKWPAPAFAAALTTATACGSATGPRYQGQPLFTISGQMITHDTAPELPIRLAVAWYADRTTLGGPQAIVTQDVQYQGSFPLDYTFSFYGPPPDSALNVTTLDGSTFRASWGVLIAYEDLNGNGQLDVIPAGAAPIDRILATSIGDLFNGDAAPNPIRVAYIDGTPPASLNGYVPGYNLYGQKQDTAIAAHTKAELDLGNGRAASELDLFVCPDFVTGAYLASPNSASHSPFDLPCIIPPTGGVRVAGSLLLADGIPTAWIRVTDGTDPLPQALVTWNGTPLTYSPADQAFEGTGSDFACGDAGTDELDVALPDGGPQAFLLTKPPDFSIVKPLPGIEPHFLAGAPIPVNWTSGAPGATVYTLSLISTLPPYGDDLQQSLPAATGPAQGFTLTAPDVDGPEWLTVFAATSDQPVFGSGGSVLFPGTYRSAYIDLAPADAGLGAFGSLLAVHDQTRRASFSQVLVQPYEGAIALSDQAAQVSANGHPMVWTPSNGGYSYDSSRTILDAGAISVVEVMVQGLGTFEADVSIPGQFDIVAPTGPIAPGDLVNLSWSPSAGAAGYNVLIEANDGGTQIPLNEVSTNDAGLAIVMPAQTGTMRLSVYALGQQTDRHFSGAVVEQLEVVVKTSP